MYENVSEQRKQELNILKVWAECAGDTYYYSMPQSRFDKNMEGRIFQSIFPPTKNRIGRICQRNIKPNSINPTFGRIALSIGWLQL